MTTATFDPDHIDAASGFRWGGCIAVMAAVHVGIGLIVVNWQVTIPQPPAEMALVMIDLPPAEPAPPVPEPIPIPAPPEPAPPPPPPQPEPPPPEPPPPEPPPPEPPPPEPPLPVEIPPAPLAPKPAVVVPPKPKPIPRPKPRPVEQVKPLEQPPPVVQAPPPVAAPPAPAPAAAPPAPATPAPPPADAVAAWTGKLLAHLNRHKRTLQSTRMRNDQGMAYVRFRMDRSGNVLSARLERSSGDATLDEEATSLLQRAQPLPPLPPEMTDAVIERVLPIQLKPR